MSGIDAEKIHLLNQRLQQRSITVKTLLSSANFERKHTARLLTTALLREYAFLPEQWQRLSAADKTLTQYLAMRFRPYLLSSTKPINLAIFESKDWVNPISLDNQICYIAIGIISVYQVIFNGESTRRLFTMTGGMAVFSTLNFCTSLYLKKSLTETVWKGLLALRLLESEITQEPDSQYKQQRLSTIHSNAKAITTPLRFNFQDMQKHMPFIDTSRNHDDPDYQALSNYVATHPFSREFVSLSSCTIMNRMNIEKMMFINLDKNNLPKTIEHTIKKLEQLPYYYWMYLLLNTLCNTTLFNTVFSLFLTPEHTTCISLTLSLLLAPIVSNHFLHRCATSFLMRDCYEIEDSFSNIITFTPQHKLLISKFTNWKTGIKAAYMNFFTGERSGDYAHFRQAQLGRQTSGSLPRSLALYTPFLQGPPHEEDTGFSFIDHN